MKTGTNNILVIIPCYNEEDNILPLLAALRQVRIAGCHIHPLVINDASTDGTAARLTECEVNVLENPVNLGIGGTMQLGFIYAAENKYDFAVQMDGDGQHPPTELEKLIAPLLNNEADMIIGSRFLTGGGFRSTFLRRMGIRFFYRLNKFLTGIAVKDATSGYRAYNRAAIAHAVAYYPDEYPEPEVITYMAHHRVRIAEVPVIMNERGGGVSSISELRTVYYMAKVFLNIIFLHLKMKFNG